MRASPAGHLFLFLLAASACRPVSTPESTSEPVAASVAAPSIQPAATETRTPEIAPSLEPATPAPILGNWHDLIFHDGIGQVVLVNGGPETGKPSTDPLELWTWDGARWALLSADPNGPAWRNFGSVAYDSTRQVLVLHGGLQSESEEFDETWEWDGTAWSLRFSGGPGPREGASMAYDGEREVTVLFGGAQAGLTLADTWEWNGETWSQVPAIGPSARFPAGFTYDPANRLVILFGGHTIDAAGFTTFGDTWSWDGAAWEFLTDTGPASRDGARAVFDPQTGAVLLFGGVQIDPAVSYFDDTWLWEDGDWRELPVEGPPGRVHHAMAVDAARGVIVLTGGSNAPGVLLPDVWEWDGETWSCVYRCGGFPLQFPPKSCPPPNSPSSS